MDSEDPVRGPIALRGGTMKEELGKGDLNASGQPGSRKNRMLVFIYMSPSPTPPLL